MLRLFLFSIFIDYNKLAATIVFLILIYALFFDPFEISNGKNRNN